MIGELEKQMKEAAKNLEFEKAAILRDQIFELRSILAEDSKTTSMGKSATAGRRRIVLTTNYPHK